MKYAPEISDATAERDRTLLELAALALAAGAGVGLICALFRLSLDAANRFQHFVLPLAHEKSALGLALVVAGAAAATAIAAWLVRRFSKFASGSGIPHVEAVLEGVLPPAHPILLPVKFVGGLLAIGAGLPLGREGPSVQMGAVMALTIGRTLRCSWADCRALLAAGAGAGLSTAFNAPMAGFIFVLEELVQKFETRTAIAALGASSAAIFVARFFIGNQPDFDVAPLLFPSAATQPLFLVLGVLAGLLGVAYNKVILGAFDAAERTRSLPVELRAALIGGSVGAVAWFLPDLIGGGDRLAQRMLNDPDPMPLAAIALALILRMALGSFAYAAGTPGGLFAPLLAVGAQLGIIFGALCARLFPTLDIQPEAFAVVGMAALFAGMVRAPLTGVVLIFEMTANTTLLLPLVGASFTAMLVPTLFENAPIYTALRDRAIRKEGALRLRAGKE